jgi:hypothetical protein
VDILKAHFIEKPPVIDGRINDAVWRTVEPISEFRTYKPDFGRIPSEKTEVFIAYDHSSLYIAFRCLESEPGKIKATISRRDGIETDDWVSVILDTLDDQQNGYMFNVNPFGIQMDGIIDSDGNPDLNFDTAWNSQGVVDDRGYVVEMAVPFKSLRFPLKENLKIRAGFFRNISRRSEWQSFPEINPERGSFIGQFQKIELANVQYERCLELIPAITMNQIESLHQGKMQRESARTEIALTGKIGLTSKLTLDWTINPDFSQVEADAGEIDINLRYGIFYSEKRAFFLEGLENFNFGAWTDANPLGAVVHTRTIINPLFGLKLNGKLTPRDVCLVMFAVDEFTESSLPEIADEASGNKAIISITRYKHLFKNDSFIGGFYTDRELNGGYNRVLGIDGRIRLNNVSFLEYNLFHSFTLNQNLANETQGNIFSIRYNRYTRKWILETGFIEIGKEFQTEMGYLTRTGITRVPVLIQYSIFPKSKIFQRIKPFYYATLTFDKYSNLFEAYNLISIHVEMVRMTQLWFELVKANEIFSGQRFNCDLLGFHFMSQLNKDISAAFIIHSGNGIYYDPNHPLAGTFTSFSLSSVIQFGKKLSCKLDASCEYFRSEADSAKRYKYTILRNQSFFHINKHIFFRGILEYNFYLKQFRTDLLASFTYIPGTALYVGYGSVYDQIHWNGSEYEPANDYLNSKRGFFIKASYLWRL